ncbi:MAG: (Fe-S)-binding protein [Deltaproteobacteria bacterium]|uniref:(Fe-S)-binding protein n=1 Tax=Candidatus Zymogenus saltonus TaxID=2844893 RepID=A0A9D8KDG6_9DELT|nr:(Fe-S)-binding protein [Candidatus Zymogenus saltonus]
MTEDMIEMTRLCSVCFRMCRDYCSVAAATRKESDSPSNRAFFAEGIINEKRELTPEVVDYFFRCAICRACREACETGQDTGEVMLNARRELDEGLLPQRVKEIREKLINGKLYGKTPKQTKDLLASKKAERSAKTVIYLGDMVRAEGGETIKALFSLLEKLGVDFSVMDEDPDTGGILYYLGFTKDAVSRAEKLSKKVGDLSPETLVILTADDLRMTNLVYSSIGVELKGTNIISLPEYLLKVLRESGPKLSSEKGLRVTYHDPCGLGRELRIFEAPRQIINMVENLEFVELPFSRDRAPCCGYGMGLSYTHPDVAAKMAERIVSIGSMSRADLLITGCPTCRDVILENFSKKVSEKPKIEIVDLPIFLDRILK